MMTARAIGEGTSGKGVVVVVVVGVWENRPVTPATPSSPPVSQSVQPSESLKMV